MAWIIYYGDGSEWRSDEGPVEAVPGQNVQMIIQEDESVGWHSISGHHNYWYENGVWYGGNDYGLFDYMIQPGWKKVVYGRTLSNARFKEIRRKADEDKALMEKSAYYPWERRA